MARIFISHSHKDEVEAIALSDWLISQGWGGEDDIFLDLDPKRGLVGGERWEEALRRNVRRCEAIVFVVTPADQAEELYFNQDESGAKASDGIIDHSEDFIRATLDTFLHWKTQFSN